MPGCCVPVPDQPGTSLAHLVRRRVPPRNSCFLLYCATVCGFLRLLPLLFCTVLYCIASHRCIIVPHCTCVLVFLPALFCILPGLHQPPAPCPSPRLASPIEPARWESPPPLLAAALTCMSSRLASTQLHSPSANPRTRQGHPTTAVSSWSSCTARLPGLHDAEPAPAGLTATTWTWIDDILSAILLAASIFSYLVCCITSRVCRFWIWIRPYWPYPTLSFYFVDSNLHRRPSVSRDDCVLHRLFLFLSPSRPTTSQAREAVH